ncbi:hypothetical protein BDQ17DRAFT_1357867 [Cyathus striatus]|nr:hypothetical protein BDQ17DRAFT_1357867 [Cyathus striatus]
MDALFQLCSPRRRKMLALGFIAFLVAVFLFVKDSAITASLQAHWDEVPPLHTSLQSLGPSVVTTTVLAPAGTDTIIAHAPMPQAVVFVLIMWSEPSAAEGALLVKSILMYNSSPSEFHIVCDDVAEKFLRQRLSLLTRTKHRVTVHFYKPSWQSMLDRIQREGSIQTDHSAGLPGLMKLFLHEIIPSSVEKGIYVDTDAFFISDPTSLWKVFHTLNASTAIVMASHPDQNSPEWNNASRICSCVMLLDFKKLRALRLMDSHIYREDHTGKYPPALSPPAFRAMYGLPGGDGKGQYDNVRLGDQGYWWAIIDYRPDIFEPLSYDFEVTSCLLDTYLTGLGNEAITEDEELSHQIHLKDTPQEGKVVLPKLLHFNCLHGTPIYMEWSGWSDPENGLTKRWGAALQYHVGYKWIWLNTASMSTSMVIQTFPDIIFADEQYKD